MLAKGHIASKVGAINILLVVSNGGVVVRLSG